MERYFVYFVDKNSRRISAGIAPAISKEAACEMFEEHGRVLAVLRIEDGRFIKIHRLSYALSNSGYTDEAIEFICTAVSEFEQSLGR